MITAQELRIGNWVNRKYWNPHPTSPSWGFEACKVHAIKTELVNVILNDKSIIKLKYEYIDPIPLSADLLEKAGFVKNEHSPWWTKSQADKEDISINKPYDTFHEGTYWTKIETLHHLQNLYYALTGHELTIEL